MEGKTTDTGLKIQARLPLEGKAKKKKRNKKSEPAEGGRARHINKTGAKEHKSILTKKQTGIILMLLGVFLISFIVLFMYTHAIRTQDPASVLPAEDVVSYVSFDLLQKTSRELTIFGNELFTQLWDAPIEFAADIFGNSFAVASMKPVVEKEKPEPLLVGYPQNAAESLSKIFEQTPKEELYLNTPLYVSDTYVAALYGEFLIVSRDREIVERIVETQFRPVTRLSSLYSFRKQANTDSFFAAFGTDTSSIPIVNRLNGSYMPFDSFNFSVRQKITHVEFDARLFPKTPVATGGKRFTAALLQYLPPAPSLVLGGSGDAVCLDASWDCPEFLPRFTPLLGTEHVFAIYGNDVLLISKLETAMRTAAMETLEKNLKTALSFIAPEKKSFALQDGSSGTEFRANPEAIVITATQSPAIKEITLPEKTWKLSYVVMDDGRFVLSSSAQLLESALQKQSPSFRESPAYSATMRGTLRGIDTVIFANSEILADNNYAAALGLGTLHDMAVSEKSNGRFLELFGILRP